VGLLFDDRAAPALAAAVCQLARQPRDRAAVRAYAEGFGWEWTSRAQVDLFTRLALRGAAA
jgi:teichuronic acid biosynthesis glycosyltransferase TuaC